MGPLKFTTARPISAPYSSCSLRIDSGEPSKPDKLARTTTGRLLLAALMARATFLEDCGNSVPGSPVVGAVGGNKSQARHGLRFDADQTDRDSRRDERPRPPRSRLRACRPSAPAAHGPGRRPPSSLCGYRRTFCARGWSRPKRYRRRVRSRLLRSRCLAVRIELARRDQWDRWSQPGAGNARPGAT